MTPSWAFQKNANENFQIAPDFFRQAEGYAHAPRYSTLLFRACFFGGNGFGLFRSRIGLFLRFWDPVFWVPWEMMTTPTEKFPDIASFAGTPDFHGI
jgi:hypothetical protein